MPFYHIKVDKKMLEDTLKDAPKMFKRCFAAASVFLKMGLMGRNLFVYALIAKTVFLSSGTKTEQASLLF